MVEGTLLERWLNGRNRSSLKGLSWLLIKVSVEVDVESITVRNVVGLVCESVF